MRGKLFRSLSAAGAVLAMTASAFTGGINMNVNVSAATLLHAEFETTNDSFRGRYGSSAAWTSDRQYSENCSIFVSGRESAWQGVERDVSSIMKADGTYQVSAAVLQESGKAVEMKLTLQYKDASGETGYSMIDQQKAESGEWLVLSNTAYRVPSGASELVLYVETIDSVTDYYVDSVIVKGKPSVQKPGDANGDASVDRDDLPVVMDYLAKKSSEIEDMADVNEDGNINIADFCLLKHDILNPVIPDDPQIDGDWDSYVEQASPEMLQVYKDGVYRVGNTQRIREKIGMAQRGEDVNIAYIGGSITQDGSASTHANCFANLSYKYFSETFGRGGNVHYINAGMAGTSSVVGNLRMEKDVFSKNADIIFIEFAVNDQGDERFKKSYEALVNKCLDQPNAPAVVCVTLCQKSFGSNQDWMVQIAENYDLPVISGKNAIENAVKRGTLDWDRDYGSGDTIHPGDGGHKLIADIIAYYYRQALRSENTTDSYVKPDTQVFGREYSTARVVSIDDLSDFNSGSWTVTRDGLTFSKNGNEPITFKTRGKGIMLLFRSKDDNSMGTALVTVNGKTNKVTAKLPWTWGGWDGNLGYYQPDSGELNVSVSMEDPSKSFDIYGIAVIE